MIIIIQHDAAIVQEMSSIRTAEHDKTLYELSQRRYAISLLPFRCEPNGFLGLKAHSCGLPCLVPTHASIAPLISRLVSEPHYFLGKRMRRGNVFARICLSVYAVGLRLLSERLDSETHFWYLPLVNLQNI